MAETTTLSEKGPARFPEGVKVPVYSTHSPLVNPVAGLNGLPLEVAAAKVMTALDESVSARLTSPTSPMLQTVPLIATGAPQAEFVPPQGLEGGLQIFVT